MMFKSKFISKLVKILCFVIGLNAIGCVSTKSYQTTIPEPTSMQGKRGTLPQNAESGKCYAQHKLQKFTVDTLNFIEYTGDDFELEGIEKKEIKVAPGSVKWETKVDPNCKVTPKNNCEIKCLVEIPPKLETIYMVVDTNKIKTYEKRIIEKKQFVKTEPEWLEVICESMLTNNFYKKLSNKLIEISYLDTNIYNFSRSEIKEAFRQYQLDNNLPSGNFFVVTLTHIGL